MRFLIAISAFVIAAGVAGPVRAVELPQDVPVPAKGTIGLVCVDATGVEFFWNSDKAAYDRCINDVVSDWATKISSDPSGYSDASGEELIQGMPVFRDAVSRASASRSVCK
jgi:hypothetical protein